MTQRALPRLVDVDTKTDPLGSLGIVEAQRDAGFVFKRLYFIYGAGQDAVRGRHAHKDLHQYMLAIHGSFRITLEAAGQKHEFTLDTPSKALLIPPGYWRELDRFSTDAVCLVAASAEYDESDYIRNHDEFLTWESHS